MIVAVAIFIALASFVYAIAGQAGGTAFIAVMALANFPQAQIRPTALVLNVVASGYATWRLHQYGLIDWKLFRSSPTENRLPHQRQLTKFCWG